MTSALVSARILLISRVSYDIYHDTFGVYRGYREAVYPLKYIKVPIAEIVMISIALSSYLLSWKRPRRY